MRSEEIEVAGIVIGFDNRLNVAIRIDLFEQRLRHVLPSLFPVAICEESNTQTCSLADLPFDKGRFNAGAASSNCPPRVSMAGHYGPSVNISRTLFYLRMRTAPANQEVHDF